MKISEGGKEFIAHPPYVGQAVCVDVTEIKTVKGDYGDRDIFRLVFETKHIGEDGKPMCVWSTGFTPTLNEKSNLRKFLRQMNGRDFTAAELKEFDTDTLLGRNVQIVIVHNEHEGKVFANIASATPWTGTPMTASGNYKRKAKSDVHKNEPPKGSEPQAAAGSYLLCKVHVGKNAGVELRELSREAIQRIIEHWLPTRVDDPRATADDKRLVAALKEYTAAENAKKVEPSDNDGGMQDEIPF
jgi:hypothetical protein